MAERYDRLDSLFEGFGSRVAIGDLDDKAKTAVIDAIVDSIGAPMKAGGIPQEAMVKISKVLTDELPQVYFNITTLEVDPTGDSIENIAKELDETPAVIAKMIEEVLDKMSDVLESEDPEFDDRLEDETDDTKHAAEDKMPGAINRTYLEVGKQHTSKPAFRGKMNKAIKNLEWIELTGTVSLPAMQGLGIKGVIKDFKLPGVDKVAYTNAMAPFGLYGIQANYKKGDIKRIRLYVLDKGDAITPLCVDEYDAPEGKSGNTPAAEETAPNQA